MEPCQEQDNWLRPEAGLEHPVGHRNEGKQAVTVDKWTDWIPEDSGSRSCQRLHSTNQKSFEGSIEQALAFACHLMPVEAFDLVPS